jgi:hypothetical protein
LESNISSAPRLFTSSICLASSPHVAVTCTPPNFASCSALESKKSNSFLCQAKPNNNYKLRFSSPHIRGQNQFQKFHLQLQLKQTYREFLSQEWL